MQKAQILNQGKCRWMLVIVHDFQGVVWNVLLYGCVSFCHGDVDSKGQEESWVESERQFEQTHRYYDGRN
jgi:hypothetical protein